MPRERAEKLRSRRYGRRRAVAHPLYSGGMYVSTTATDSVKRILSNEIFNLGIDVLPTKRPRGNHLIDKNKLAPFLFLKKKFTRDL